MSDWNTSTSDTSDCPYPNDQAQSAIILKTPRTGNITSQQWMTTPRAAAQG